MKKHSKQLEKRIEQQKRFPPGTAVAVAAADRRRSSKCKNGILKNESSPELSRPACRKSRQYFLEPIRRWNSFHNSRERKSTAAAAAAAAATDSSADTTIPASSSSSSSSTSNLPYLQTLVNLQRESKSACARLAQSVLPKIPRVADSAPVLNASTAGTQPPSPLQQTAATGCPAKKQNSSPNLLLVYDRRQQGGVACDGGGGNSLTNSPRRSARRPKTPPPHHHGQQQQQLAANSSSIGTDATGSSKIPFAITVGDTPIVRKDAVPRIKAIRADSVTEKSSSSYLAVDLSPHRRYSFWSVSS